MMDTHIGSVWTDEVIDAYCHVGEPKYGTLADATGFFRRLDIKRGILALGPGVPDIESLIQARARFGDNIRVMGIPFGETVEQRRELGECQIRAGISGMRLMPQELIQNKELVDVLGERGLWLYAINPFDAADSDTPTARYLLDWLDKHPTGKVASPHFLRPKSVYQITEHTDLFVQLLMHPRYHAILSRFGGSQSTQPYPHPDLRQWVEQIAGLMTWKRILWGSEFPIIFQRSEQPEQARDWLLNLGIDVGVEDASLFYAGNAQRLFFDHSPPPTEEITVPSWVEEQIDPNQTVYLFPSTQVYISMQDHRVLLSEYMKLTEEEPTLSYANYVARLLSQQASMIRSRGEKA